MVRCLHGDVAVIERDTPFKSNRARFAPQGGVRCACSSGAEPIHITRRQSTQEDPQWRIDRWKSMPLRHGEDGRSRREPEGPPRDGARRALVPRDSHPPS